MRHGSNDVAFLLVDGYSILGVVTDIEDTLSAVIEDTTPLGVGFIGQEFTGVKMATLKQTGFYDDAVGSVNAALVNQQGASRIVSYGFEGNVIGKHANGYSGAFAAQYHRTATVKQLHKANADYVISGTVDSDGMILHALQAETTAGNTQASSVDNGASSSTGLNAYLQLPALALGGYTNLIVKVRHSADNASWADLATFTAVTVAPGAQRLTVASGTTINRYLAISWAWTGSGSSQSVTFMVAAKRT